MTPEQPKTGEIDRLSQIEETSENITAQGERVEQKIEDTIPCLESVWKLCNPETSNRHERLIGCTVGLNDLRILMEAIVRDVPKEVEGTLRISEPIAEYIVKRIRSKLSREDRQDTLKVVQAIQEVQLDIYSRIEQNLGNRG